MLTGARVHAGTMGETARLKAAVRKTESVLKIRKPECLTPIKGGGHHVRGHLHFVNPSLYHGTVVNLVSPSARTGRLAKLSAVRLTTRNHALRAPPDRAAIAIWERRRFDSEHHVPAGGRIDVANHRSRRDMRAVHQPFGDVVGDVVLKQQVSLAVAVEISGALIA